MPTIRRPRRGHTKSIIDQTPPDAALPYSLAFTGPTQLNFQLAEPLGFQLTAGLQQISVYEEGQSTTLYEIDAVYDVSVDEFYLDISLDQPSATVIVRFVYAQFIGVSPDGDRYQADLTSHGASNV